MKTNYKQNKDFSPEIIYCLFYAQALIYLQNKQKVTTLWTISIAPINSRENMKVIKILVLILRCFRNHFNTNLEKRNILTTISVYCIGLQETYLKIVQNYRKENTQVKKMNTSHPLWFSRHRIWRLSFTNARWNSRRF